MVTYILSVAISSFFDYGYYAVQCVTYRKYEAKPIGEKYWLYLYQDFQPKLDFNCQKPSKAPVQLELLRDRKIDSL